MHWQTQQQSMIAALSPDFLSFHPMATLVDAVAAPAGAGNSRLLWRKLRGGWPLGRPPSAEHNSGITAPAR